MAEDKGMAGKWLARSIFDVLDINKVEKAKNDSRVTMLDTQYRMNPGISAIPNRLFYRNTLNDHESTADCQLDDGVSQSPLVLIETSAANPWCSRLSTGGRFNLYNALVSVALAKRVSQNIQQGRIGIITPYAAQSRLLNKILKDWDLLEVVRANTVHRFQGGEEQVIIIDTCEGPVLNVAPMLNDRVDSTARLLFNVAMTRAKSKLYLVGHTQHILSQLHADTSLAQIITHFHDNAEIIPSSKLVDNYLATDFEKWAEVMLSTPELSKEPISGDQFTEKNFWAQFLRDIKTVSERLFILSPFLTVRRTSVLINYLQAMVGKGVDVRVFTKPGSEHKGEMANQAHSVMEQLRNIGVQVIERSRLMHQKLAILDNSILWGGSLNILSHRDTEEQMWRFEGPTCIDETMKNLDLYEKQPTINQIKKQPIDQKPVHKPVKAQRSTQSGLKPQRVSDVQIDLVDEHEFEKYIQKIFTLQQKYFAIESWNTDLHVEVENSRDPDFVIRYKPTNEVFAIECKYQNTLRASEIIKDRVLKWAKPAQIKRYNQFSSSRDIPVFIVIGLGGDPDEPECVYCMPLNMAQYPEIFPSVLTKHTRKSPNSPFFWKDGLLK
ncbi:MAG: hypothetical protein HN936_04860 [Bacteroidetes bacterium]|nr:hypothetical protein [Bacteroidota bacterium]